MNNKGRIVVFISMMTAVMLVLITLVLQVVVLSAAKSKTVIASRLAMSDVKACYNSYIFEHYHILLFDKTAGGRGEAYLEEVLEQEFSDKLGEEYRDTQAFITETRMLTDRSYAAFKEQIQEYMVYAMAQQGVQLGVDKIREKTGEEDGKLPENLKEEMEDAENHATVSEDVETYDLDSEDADIETGTSGTAKTEKDPRKYTKNLSESMILRLVLPEGKTVSSAYVEQENASSLLSYGRLISSDYKEVDRDFDDMSNLIDGLTALGSWQDSLFDAGAELAYSGLVFNSYQEEKNETAVLAYEQEYLIAGRLSDYENLQSVAHRMIGIRFPINYIGLCKQADKMEILAELAASIAWAAPYLIPTLKYLLAGCWAYIESIADVRVLFDGKKAAYVKNAETWITDIYHIGESLSEETKDVENGLDYQNYLTILQAMNMDNVTVRMLDLIQINTMQEEPEFRIRNAAVGFAADFESSYGGQLFQFHQSAEY